MSTRVPAWLFVFAFGWTWGDIPLARAQQFSVVVTGTLPDNSTTTGTILANSATFADLVSLSLQNPASSAAAAESAFRGNRPWSYQISGFGNANSFTFGSTDTSNTIVFNYPRLGISKSFTGANRSESYQELIAFLRTLNVTDAAIAGPKAPSNPVAGNPGSLAALISRQSFNSAVGGPGVGGGRGGTLGSVGNIIGLSADYQSLRQSGSTTRVLELPLSWTIRSDIDPGRMLIISAPLAQADVEGVKVNYYGLGVGYRLPLKDSWGLTPSLHYGGMSSGELNVKSSVINASLTSAYAIELSKSSARHAAARWRPVSAH